MASASSHQQPLQDEAMFEARQRALERRAIEQHRIINDSDATGDIEGRPLRHRPAQPLPLTTQPLPMAKRPLPMARQPQPIATQPLSMATQPLPMPPRPMQPLPKHPPPMASQPPYMAMQPQFMTMRPQFMAMQPQSKAISSKYDDLIITDPNDLLWIGDKPEWVQSFESACREGPLEAVQSVIDSSPRTPAFLHNGLVLALAAGNVETAASLLAAGAPIVRETAANILDAPSAQQIPLFEVLTTKGWTPNSPRYYGSTLLPKTIGNVQLLRWFLAHRADPNLGPPRAINRDRFDRSGTDSCEALEIAAEHGTVEEVRLLLDAGARIQNGTPLHRAAGACPPGASPFAKDATPTKEFDQGRIPIMELLVERGADVNLAEESRYVVIKYAVVHAIMVGAVERVRWLLRHGADPDLRGPWGSTRQIAHTHWIDEMKAVVEEECSPPSGEGL